MTAELTSIGNLEADIRQAHGLPTNKLVLNLLLEISREIPENANNIDSHMAEYLSGRFLKGLDLCGELYALAVSHEMTTELLRKKEFSDAMIIRSATLKTAKEKEISAHADLGYLSASEKYIAAKMFRHLVEEKKEAFSKAHYLMRKIVDKSIIGDDTPRLVTNEDNASKEWSLRSTWAK